MHNPSTLARLAIGVAAAVAACLQGDTTPSQRARRVFLPAERKAPALRGNSWFYVARTRHAWVIWDEPH